MTDCVNVGRYEKVAYLDTDLGQPEFTPPGFVSLNVLSDPILGAMRRLDV